MCLAVLVRCSLAFFIFLYIDLLRFKCYQRRFRRCVEGIRQGENAIAAAGGEDLAGQQSCLIRCMLYGMALYTVWRRYEQGSALVVDTGVELRFFHVWIVQKELVLEETRVVRTEQALK